MPEGLPAALSGRTRTRGLYLPHHRQSPPAPGCHSPDAGQLCVSCYPHLDELQLGFELAGVPKAARCSRSDSRFPRKANLFKPRIDLPLTSEFRSVGSSPSSSLLPGQLTAEADLTPCFSPVLLCPQHSSLPEVPAGTASERKRACLAAAELAFSHLQVFPDTLLRYKKYQLS